MPTTTNFGWTTPADTDLVKDGAAAIRTLGSNIDTSLVDLKGGTTGQYLQKNSNTDLDYVWATVSAGGMTLISETTASALSSLSLSSIPGTYKQLLLIWSGLKLSANNTTWYIRLNNSSSLAYNQGGLMAEGGTFNNVTSRNTEIGQIGLVKNVTGTTLEQMSQGFLTIDNYSSTSNFKNYFYKNVFKTIQGDNQNENLNGVFSSTSAITSIDFVRTTGTGTLSNDTSTSIRLYGLS